MLTEKYGELNTLKTKITLDLGMWGPFQNKFSVIVC